MAIFDISEQEKLAVICAQFAKSIKTGVVFLRGDLGVGKTAMVQWWLRALGYQNQVTSPTYNLVNEYEVQNGIVLHADLYRLSQPDELLYLDVEDWTTHAHLIFIEWAENGEGFLPPADFYATLSLSKGVRTLEWRSDK